jgi:hypothetical protein
MTRPLWDLGLSRRSHLRRADDLADDHLRVRSGDQTSCRPGPAAALAGAEAWASSRLDATP